MSGIALKLTSLLVRTVAKPIATTITALARNNDVFKSGCIRVAQAVHSTDVKLRMRLVGQNKVKVRPLNDKKAIENGAKFLSEALLFSVAGSLIIYESVRSRRKAQDEKQSVRGDISDLQEDIGEVKNLLKALSKEIDNLQKATHDAAEVQAKQTIQARNTIATGNTTSG